MQKIAGVVIAFYPDIEKLSFNTSTVIHQIDLLFIYFNSEVTDEDVQKLREVSPKIELIFNNENKGIAETLNLSAQRALNLGYSWLLTMDQDSWFPANTFFEMFRQQNVRQVAIFSPNPDLSAGSEKGKQDLAEEVLHVITSGNLLNLEIWKIVGGFEEKLFIDEVDNDYCLRAVSKGFKIISFKNCPLVHELGINKEVFFLFKKYTIITHSPIRAYYIFRNNFYMFNKYKKSFPEFVRLRKRILIKDFFKILLFSSERIRNFRYIYRGIRDYYNGNYGPIVNG